MAFTVQDFSDLLRLLEEHPEWRAQLQALILPEGFASLPDQLAQLVQTLQETQQAIANLAQAFANSSRRFELLLATQEQRLARLEDLVAQQGERLARLEDLVAQQGERLARLEDLVAQQGERLARLEDLVAQQGERLARLEDLVAQQGERLARLEDLVAQQAARLDRHEERLTRLEEAVAELAQITRELVETTRSVLKRLDRLEERQATLSGFYYEMQYRDRAPAYLGRLMKRARGFLPQEIEDIVESHLSSEEMEDFYHTDVVVRGVWRGNGEQVFLALEVSETVDANDVVRAVRRANLLRKAGLRAMPAVGGARRNEEALALAYQQGVLVLIDGKVENMDLVEQGLSPSC
jgi:uncharacterized coiled-coil protein SlyX/predicted DNA-binding protein